MAFEIRIPAGKVKASNTGGTPAGIAAAKASEKEEDKNTKELKSLTKAVAIGNVIANTLKDATEGLRQLISPLIKILSALLIVAFMPLIPLLTKLTEALGDLVGAMAKGGGGIKGLAGAVGEGVEGSIVKRVMAVIIGILLLVGAGIMLLFLAATSPIWASFAAVAAVVAGIATLLFLAWDDHLKPAFTFISEKLTELWESLIGIWNMIVQAFKDFGTAISEAFALIVEWFVELPGNLKDALTKGLEVLSGLGKIIIDAIKKALGGIGSFFGDIGSNVRETASSFNPFNDFIQRPGMSPVGFSPQDTIIGVKDTGTLGGNTTVNINNPVVREDSDIRKMTDAISKELQRRGNRGFSNL